MSNLPKFSFSLPVYDAEEYLASCLESIYSQDYPQDKIEVLLVDGGSADRTLEIAGRFPVRIFNNPRKLADFGAKISVDNATGEFFVIFAADNELVGKNWLKDIAQLFIEDKDLSAVWGRMVSGKNDAPINKYYELIQNDPLSFFINRNLQNYLKNAEKRDIDGRRSYVFSVNAKRPLIWGANGLVYRTELVKDIILKDEFIGDNDVFQIMVEDGNNKVAYIPNLDVCHHHVKKAVRWMGKWRRNFLSHFLRQRESRNLNWAFNRNFNINVIFWTVYSGIPVFSWFHAFCLSIRDKNLRWFYHPIVSFLQLITYLYLMISTPEGRSLVKERLPFVH